MSQTTGQSSDSFDLEPITLAPGILRAARNIYQAYADTHGSKQVPLGVALDRYTLRGQLIFTGRPILLPHECFVPMQNIEMFDDSDEAEEG
ncbi:hypothetical protein [Altericista sp. CCNU0014]|uniref:hypothetical protein n=1 Tax=Altericista sp. CCNU0014 TaxID=3082949 RepID=UPI00384DA7DE